MKFDIVQLLGALAVFIPALLGAIKTYKSSSDSDKRLQSLEEWQKQQDQKLQAIMDDQERAFKEQGQHRYKLDHHVSILERQVGETKQQLAKVPTRTEFNYRRPETMELTPMPPLPSVAPPVDPITDKFDVVDEDEFKPRRKKR